MTPGSVMREYVAFNHPWFKDWWHTTASRGDSEFLRLCRDWHHGLCKGQCGFVLPLGGPGFQPGTHGYNSKRRSFIDGLRNFMTTIPLYYFYWSVYNYAAYAADIFTPIAVAQGVDNHCWGSHCRRCYCIRVCWGRSSRKFYFSRWLGQLSTALTNDESPHTGYTFTPWVVSFTAP